MAEQQGTPPHMRQGAVDDLAGGATTAQTVTKVNEILEALRKAGLISR